MDIGLAQLAGKRALTVYLLANRDVHWLNGMTNCPTSQINFSHCVTDGLRRPNCLFGKMRGNSLFHILWASRSSFSPCPYGIVVVVFHFDSGGRKAKQSCFSSVCRSSAFPWSSDVLFQNPAGPTFQTQTCNIGGKISILLPYM